MKLFMPLKINKGRYCTVQEKQYLEEYGAHIPIHRQIKLEISANQIREKKEQGIPIGETIVHAILRSHGLRYENLSYPEINYLYHLVDHPLEKIKNF